jgi:hypothetical protein
MQTAPALRYLCKTAAALALPGLAFFSSGCAAFGLDEIYSPNITYREISLEYNASGAFDPHANKDGARATELALEAGITPQFLLAASGGYEKLPGDVLRFMARQVEGRYQFFEPGERGVDAGMLVSYRSAVQTSTADSLEVKLLLQTDTGRFTHTANIGFAQDVGQYAAHSGGPDYVFLWNTRYRYSPGFQPGIEIQSDLGQGARLGRFNSQENYVGLSAFGTPLPHWKYQAAYFLGATELAARGAARVMIEYETYY